MKKKLLLTACVMAFLFMGCEPNEPQLKGVFSVAADKQVTFSPGNLQYHPANKKWRFAETQTQYIGEKNAQISSSYNGWIDLFGWGTGDNPTNSSLVSSDYQFFVDWGTNKIGKDSSKSWRTLTFDEWAYLLEKRPNANQLRGGVDMNGVSGLLLLPDNWESTADITLDLGSEKYPSFTADQWSQLEALGAVFLPAAGWRSGDDVEYVQFVGAYWSSTGYAVDAFSVYFFFDEVVHIDVGVRDTCHSVRLVKDL